MSATTGDIDISDGGVRIAKSNVLRWVRTDNQAGTLPLLDNRLLGNLVVPNTDDDWNYFPKYDNTGTGDQINTQIATIHTIGSFSLRNFRTDVEVSSIAIPSATTTVNTSYGLVSYYDFNIDCSVLGGWYYVIATINTSQTYRCEPFYVSSINEGDTVVVKYYNNTTSYNNDGIYYGVKYNIFRLESRFFDIEPGQIKTGYSGVNGIFNLLQGNALEYVNLQLGPVPFWVIRQLNLAILHDNLFINNRQYRAEDSLNYEKIPNTYIYSGSVKLQDIGFESYDVLEAVAAEETHYVIDKNRNPIRTKTGTLRHKIR